jgi:hypothetical protein
MVTRRARSLFAVLLAFALLPIISMATAGAAEARAHAAAAWMQWTAKSQSAVHGTRGAFGELAVHDLGATPFTAAEPFRFSLSAPLAATVLGAPPVIATGTPVTSHRARAPPALL